MEILESEKIGNVTSKKFLQENTKLVKNNKNN